MTVPPYSHIPSILCQYYYIIAQPEWGRVRYTFAQAHVLTRDPLPVEDNGVFRVRFQLYRQF